MRGIFKIGIVVFMVVCLMGIAVTAQADTSYFRKLSIRKITFISDGCYSVCLLLGVADKYTDFESQKKFLNEKKILPERLNNAKADDVLRKGTAAYMFCKALDIKGGALLNVFRTKEKYTLRELVFKKLVADGPEQKIVGGRELLSILMRASEYKADKK